MPKPKSTATHGALRQQAALYVRVSTEEQATEGVSLAAQVERGRAYCALNGLEVIAVFTDAGVSAGRPLGDRGMGRELLDAIARGEVHHVVALKLDRLFRDAVDCLRTASEWERGQVAMHLIDLGGQAVNTTSAMGRFMLTVIAGAAEMERNIGRERTKAAMQQKKLQGERLGQTPLGFRTPGPRVPMVPVSDELEIVREILAARQRPRPLTFRAIAKRLEDRGLPTKLGGRWAAATVLRIWRRREHYSAYL